MKTTIISNTFVGSGHRRITIEYANGKTYSAITTNMGLTDDLRSELITKVDERRWRSANRRLIRFVKDRNNLR